MNVTSSRPPGVPSPAPGRGLSRSLGALVVAVSTALAGCGSPTPEGVIDREAFIDAYVELRIAALETDSSKVAATDRDAILADIGVTEDDMLAFVRAHAADLEFMRDVWNEVELRMDQPPAEVADEG